MTKNKLFFIIFSSFFIFLIVVLYAINNKESFEPEKVCFQENCFFVEIADTAEERAQGLMFRQELARDRGILFVFSKQGIYSFWMKNTLIPLDIIWIDKYQKVVFIKQDVPSCKTDICQSINPEKEAKYVLELNAGIVEIIGLKIGDKFSFEF
jgi:uncharacterized membrane protein (UPF0127 family)